MLEGWDQYYFLLASAAVGLIGLLFVVVTLTAGAEEQKATRGARLYMTPTMFHFAVVFVISAIASIGRAGDMLIIPSVGIAAIVGIVHTFPRALELREPGAAEHWTDFWFYGIIPVAGYIALGLVAATLYYATPDAVYFLALMMMAFILLGIRNAWDLVTYIAPRSKPADKQ